MRMALVSRELYPFIGGGIAPIVAATARELSSIADVTIVTSATYRESYERLRDAGDPRIPPPSVRVVFVEEPAGDYGGYLSYMHAWSARADRALRATYPRRGPDLIEFCDYLGEGFVTVQARHTGDPWLAATRVCLRLHTTAYICAILDGHLPDDFATTATFEAERYALQYADALLWSGGDVLATYQRIYGADRLAEGVKIPDAFYAEDDPGPGVGRILHEGETLQLLYLGRLERRKGIQNLIRAMTRLDSDDVHLTVLGGDTDTAPLGASVREQVTLMAADDPRISFVDNVPRDAVSSFLRDSHVVVIPSLWECWPNVAREALMHNRPVLATPVGGLCEMVEADRSGWLARDRSAEALADSIAERAADPASVTRLIAAESPRSKFQQLTDADALRARYAALLEGRQREARTRGPSKRQPLVSVVVPYYRLDDYVEETLASVADQTYPRVKVILVNDGSMRPEDAVLDRLADDAAVTVLTQVNSGLGAARNFGISQSLSEYVLPLDADDLIAPQFIERCVAALERDPQLAYVTSWVEYMDPDGVTVSDDDGGYMPFGNWSSLIRRNNVGGTCVALMRRGLFEGQLGYSTDLTSYEDWLLYLRMHELGLHGAVIPERLIRYRIRDESMMRTVGRPQVDRLFAEIAAHAREREIVWSPSDRASARAVD
jgi:glycogen(starch) synthase